MHKRIPWRRAIEVVVMLLGVVGLTLFAGVGITHGSASDGATSTSFPININVFVPCAAGGAGEVVDLSGDLHVVFNVTVASNGSFHAISSANPQGVSGTGETTGAKYQGTGVTHSNFNGNVGFETSFVNNFRIIGQGPDNNLLVHENFHITVHPDGTVTGFVDNFSVVCM
jgi:hypothetical protein